jgi:hypothetical protein
MQHFVAFKLWQDYTDIETLDINIVRNSVAEEECRRELKVFPCLLIGHKTVVQSDRVTYPPPLLHALERAENGHSSLNT